MSTRCHVIVQRTENGEMKKHYIYRHYDGYPEGAGKDLTSFLRENAEEFIKSGEPLTTICKKLEDYDSRFYFEDCCIHGDEEYLYTVDFDNRTLLGERINFGNEGIVLDEPF